MAIRLRRRGEPAGLELRQDVLRHTDTKPRTGDGLGDALIGIGPITVADPTDTGASPPDGQPERGPEAVFTLRSVAIAYGEHIAVNEVTMDVPSSQITAIIGPSGCGKSTLLRSLNRMNDVILGVSVRGDLLYHGQSLYDEEVDPVEVRRRIGMVFQKPNPFPKSIFDNIAFGLRVNGMTDDLPGRVERALKGAALWDEVKGNLRKSALALSGGQQQRLCIARAIAVEPDVILMDEPCSALDPIATAKIEDLMHELKERYSIVIVTHNMQQAARVSDMTAFMTVADTDKDLRTGVLVEYDRTGLIFTRPSDSRTEAYITGRFG
jgi:phosphate transport system ATP-binding protein